MLRKLTEMSIRELTIKENAASSNISEKDKKKAAIALNNLGHQKYLEVNFDDAVENYTKALQLDDSLAVAYYNRGTISYRMGYYKKALDDFEKAVSLDDSNEEFKKGLQACKTRYHGSLA